MQRCSWCDDSEIYKKYHDEEWGVPTHDDHELFELLVLEGMQAGLSWLTILRKRENFREAFDNFDVKKVAAYDENKIAELLANAGIIRNELKIRATITNAKVFIAIQKEFGSFDKFIWGFVDGQTIRNNFGTAADVPTSTPLSDKISRELKSRGMSFVGSTIVYAYLQSIGVAVDHTRDCFKFEKK